MLWLSVDSISFFKTVTAIVSHLMSSDVFFTVSVVSGGTVYQQEVPSGHYDHVISVSGWGVDAEVGEYWIIRNSWGTFWGENGWARLPTSKAFPNDPKKWGGDYNLNVETRCTYADPILN